MRKKTNRRLAPTILVMSLLAALCVPGLALAESVQNGRLEQVLPDEGEVVVAGRTLRVDAQSSVHLRGTMDEMSLVELEDYLGELVSVIHTGTPARVLEMSVHGNMNDD